MAEEETRDELADHILDILPSHGYLTLDTIIQSWLDIAAVKVRETLAHLKDAGKIRSDPDGIRWKLRTRPVVVAEVPGDPNFRRGGS